VTDRRSLLGALGGLSILGMPRSGRGAAPTSRPDGNRTLRLPDKEQFHFNGIHLNAAFCHPLGRHCVEAARSFYDARAAAVDRLWPIENPRDAAVAAFAGLINASPEDVAVVPSTLTGENLLAAALRLGPKRGVVTDCLHYDASLAMYGERARQGMPLTVLPMRGIGIDYDELRRSITSETRLVALSWVSSWTGFAHDLKSVCDIAHSKGALVYADVIQGVGALPFDVRDTGIDFCCCGTYKWLMGDFGAAFLYVRPERLSALQRVELGWRGLTSYAPHFLPFDTPGPTVGTWTLGTQSAQLFEVGTPDWSALHIARAAIEYIQQWGVEQIASYRAPLLEALQVELPTHGFQPLTPRDRQGPYVSFAYADARENFARLLEDARVYITVSKNKVRISASVYNDLGDVERLIDILSH
jgi:selenocysteine lyase/cysteine desulfurase